MKKIWIIGCALATVCCSPIAKTGHYTDLVNPMLGTETLWDSVELGFRPTRRTWGAEVFPGSSLPNAMVQVSPVTQFRAGAGYQYEDSLIYGFSHTNKGHWNLNHVPILPFTGEISSTDYASTYSHSREKAHPAYYEVFLNRYGIDAEMTSSLRAAYHRYTYCSGNSVNLLVNLPRSNERVVDWEISQEDTNSFSGYQNTGQTIYFYAEANYPITNLDSLPSENGRAVPIVRFGNATKPLELKIGFSFVSRAGARENLKTEIADKSFEEIHQEGDDLWNRLLAKIDVAGGSDEQRRTFYSTLYRSMLWPALRSDVDGRFTNPAGEIIKANYRYYTEPSFWDDYRNKLILLGMLAPDVACDVISSCIEMGRVSGFMPTFFHGDHASVFVTGSYLRGLRDFNVQSAYALMLRNAMVEGPSRPYLQEYIDKGYICELPLKHVEIHTDAKASVTKTQEYSYDDYAVARLAKELGDSLSYKTLCNRSLNYRNLYDPSTRFMRGKLADGSWVTDFDPCFPYYHYMYREATGWMSSFFAPHDTEGLVTLYGGKQQLEEKLDSLFSLPWKGYEAHNLSGFIGQYCHGNQPDHTVPFLYTLIGKPEKSQVIIDSLLNHFYNMGEHRLAYSGMDDAGEMSSWYVLSAIGLYTYSPADPEYLVTTPLFDRVRFKLNDTTFTIEKKGNGRAPIKITYDGKPLNSPFITHNDLLRGKRLIIQTK